MAKIINLIGERTDKPVSKTKFMCEDDIVPEKALRTAVRVFLRSEAGKKAIEIASNFFTWEDAINNVPDAVWRECGLSPMVCGDFVDIIVNQDEVLNDDNRTGCTESFGKYNFRGIVFDDVCVNVEDGLHDWSGLCEECRTKHELVDTEDCGIDYNCGSGVCGVEGCQNESDHYIDFKDGVLQSVKYCLTCGAVGINLTEHTVGSGGVSCDLVAIRQRGLVCGGKILFCDLCAGEFSNRIKIKGEGVS